MRPCAEGKTHRLVMYSWRGGQSDQRSTDEPSRETETDLGVEGSQLQGFADPVVALEVHDACRLSDQRVAAKIFRDERVGEKEEVLSPHEQ